MPNRVIREGILTSERVDRLGAPAEVFYRRLMNVVDDFGRYAAHPSLLRAALYPLRLDRVAASEVDAHLRECETAGLIRLYDAAGKRHLELLDFRQRTRAMTSKWPSPDGQPADERQTKDGQMAVICPSHDGHLRTPPPPPPSPSPSPSPGAEAGASSLDMIDGEAIAEKLYLRHPKKAGRILAQQTLAGALAESRDPEALAERIDQRHEAWCASPDWRREGGRFAPKLADWLMARGWADDPPETTPDSPRYPDPEAR